jgi:hypothetical protein
MRRQEYSCPQIFLSFPIKGCTGTFHPREIRADPSYPCSSVVSFLRLKCAHKQKLCIVCSTEDMLGNRRTSSLPWFPFFPWQVNPVRISSVAAGPRWDSVVNHPGLRRPAFRYVLGDWPRHRLNAVLKAETDRYPTRRAISLR